MSLSQTEGVGEYIRRASLLSRELRIGRRCCFTRGFSKLTAASNQVTVAKELR
ncbi:hypothetical protein HanPSC8_Chr11g0491611 [Helianthus annuus]|nr:hypothetical protein HanPSC8_Chr11g0491611 [Helianthus annuus]